MDLTNRKVGLGIGLAAVTGVALALWFGLNDSGTSARPRDAATPDSPPLLESGPAVVGVRDLKRQSVPMGLVVEVINESNQPIPRAIVLRGVQRVVTDDMGTALVHEISGPVKVWHSEYEAQMRDVSKAEEESRHMIVHLMAGHRLLGTVRDLGGTPLSGVRVGSLVEPRIHLQRMTRGLMTLSQPSTCR
jgi:hypothetical protein